MRNPAPNSDTKNPEKKILHTILVERNGFLEAMTASTPLAGKCGEVYGEHSYDEFIQPAASTRPAASSEHALSLPARAADAIGGKSLMQLVFESRLRLAAAALDAQDQATFEAYRAIGRSTVPHRSIDDEEADARKLFRTLASVGGAELVGPSQELDEHLYYRPTVPEN